MPTVAVIGNPNTGKSTLFNALTGMKQHVGNYPGVTVERKTGTAVLDDTISVELIDLPGTYSLAARSPDEMIAVDVLLNQQPGVASIDAILAIADASNPERNFYLVSQLLELGLPVVVALNMLDVAQTKGIEVDTARISATLGVPVVGICANKGKGLPELRAALSAVLKDKQAPTGRLPEFPVLMRTEIDSFHTELRAHKNSLGRDINRLEAFRALVDKGGHAETRLRSRLGSGFNTTLDAHRRRAGTVPLPAEEVRVRYKWVQDSLHGALKRPAQPPPTSSDALDRWLTHWFTGSIVFLGLMFLVFQCIMFWAKPLMNLISDGFDALALFVGSRMPEGALQSLVTSGMIKGVGAVLTFLPQICLLFLFIAVMEDCGYMARAAFLMDRLLSRVGLSGKSFIPMLSSFACAVPGVMATRTIENWRDRLTTILVSPLMSCSARLPVYLLMINSLIPDRKIAPLVSVHGLTLFSMYMLGIVVAVPVAWLLKKTLLKGETPPFLIELPSYKIPDWKGILLRVYDRAKAFVVRAGTIILAVNIVVWALAYFPHPETLHAQFAAQRETAKAEIQQRIDKAADPAALNDKHSLITVALNQAEAYDKKREDALAKRGISAENDDLDVESKAALTKIDADHAEALEALSQISGIKQAWPRVVEIRGARQELKDKLDDLENAENGEYLRQSYFGRMGKTVEPVFKPLGWDWRISMAAIASFPAREVIVATLGTIFNQGTDQKEESHGLKDALRSATWEEQPQRKLFNIPVGLSVMVFFALCSQCAATLATIKRETNSWIWPIFSFTYMTVLAYFGAMLTYQVGIRLL